jgi:hypothetical protein
LGRARDPATESGAESDLESVREHPGFIPCCAAAVKRRPWRNQPLQSPAR